MNILSFAGGAIASVFVFLICLAVAIIIKYAREGYLAGKESEEKERRKNLPKKSSEPVYYIVERKTTVNKEKYSDPKEIEFK